MGLPLFSISSCTVRPTEHRRAVGKLWLRGDAEAQGLYTLPFSQRFPGSTTTAVHRARQCNRLKDKMGLATLPVELLWAILVHLDVTSLGRLTQTSQFFHVFMCSYWSIHTKNNPRPSLTLAHSLETWSPLQIARYNHLTDIRWTRREGNIISVSPLSIGTQWRRGRSTASPRPVMAISATRAVMLSSSKLTSFAISTIGTNHVASNRTPLEGDGYLDAARVSNGSSQRPSLSDVTAAAFTPDGGKDQTLCIGTSDGRVLRVHMGVHPFPVDRTNAHHASAGGEAPPASHFLRIQETGRYEHPRNASMVTALAVSKDVLLTVANTPTSEGSGQLISSGLASMFSVRAPWRSPERLLLPGKLECAHLALEASTPFAAIGARLQRSHTVQSWDSFLSPKYPKTKGFIPTAPLTIHAITESTLSLTPLAHLSPPPSNSSATNGAYALCGPSLASPFGSSPNVIISGWFDGYVYVHDLRARAVLSQSPKLSFHHRWTDDRVYSIGMGGGNGAYVLAGMAMNGVLQVYDVRNSSGSFGVYCPCDISDRTSVYGLHVEGSRVWGLTDALFMLDFGPDNRTSNLYGRTFDHV